MEPISPISPAIPLPKVDSEDPVAVIPTASVAPLDGPPDGERINTFTLAARNNDWAVEDATVNALGEMRDHVLSKPLASVGIAFALGWMVARVLR
jgi:hypothetical protein